MSEGWAGIAMTSVAATGVIAQLYPTWVVPGVTMSSSTAGQQILKPLQGCLHSLQIKPDGTNSGYIEFWDINGFDVPVDVSNFTQPTLPTITNAQAAVLVGRTPPLAKMIYRQSFVGNTGGGVVNAAGIYRSFLHGLGARFVSDAGTGVGTCELNLVIDGGFWKVDSRGSY